jgi:hypothetical protein
VLCVKHSMCLPPHTHIWCKPLVRKWNSDNRTPYASLTKMGNRELTVLMYAAEDGTSRYDRAGKSILHLREISATNLIDYRSDNYIFKKKINIMIDSI